MSRRDWYREQDDQAEEHPVDVEVVARLEDDVEYQELRAQVLELGGMLRHHLHGEALDLWLRVEAAINDRWAIFSEEAYNGGRRRGARHTRPGRRAGADCETAGLTARKAAFPSAPAGKAGFPNRAALRNLFA